MEGGGGRSWPDSVDTDFRSAFDEISVDRFNARRSIRQDETGISAVPDVVTLLEFEEAFPICTGKSGEVIELVRFESTIFGEPKPTEGESEREASNVDHAGNRILTILLDTSVIPLSIERHDLYSSLQSVCDTVEE